MTVGEFCVQAILGSPRLRTEFDHHLSVRAPVPTARTCLFSFTDRNNIRHAVEVAASTFYEAATLAMAEFRKCGFTENAPGSNTRLAVPVKGPSTTHEVQWARSRRGFRAPGSRMSDSFRRRSWRYDCGFIESRTGHQ